MVPRFRAILRTGLPVLLLASGCGGGAAPDPATPAAAAAIEPALTPEQLERRSPAAAVVDAFNAICAEPARRRAVAREAGRRGFAPVTTAAPREEMPGAAFPPDAETWRGPAEVGGAVLLWDAATATCEVRALGADPVVVESEFAKLPQVLEDAGASVMRLPPPPPPAQLAAGAPRVRQMVLVSPGGGGADPERARVLRLADGDAKDSTVLSARSVAGGARPATAPR